MWPNNTISGGEIIQQIKCYDLIGGGSCTNIIELIHKVWQ